MTSAQDLLDKNYTRIDVEDTVGKLFGTLKKNRVSSALVFRNETYLGVIEKHFLAHSRLDPAVTKVKNAVKKRSRARTPFYVPALKPTDDLRTMSKLFSASGVSQLPVIEKGKILGVVHSDDVAQEVCKEYAGVTCDLLASTKLKVCRLDDPVSSAMKTLNSEGIDHLPVIDNDGTLAGIVSTTDLLRSGQLWDTDSQRVPGAAQHQGFKKSGYDHGEKISGLNVPVKNFTSKKSICCAPPSTKVKDAIAQMRKAGVHTLILVKNQKPVGILTVKDILNDYAKS